MDLSSKYPRILEKWAREKSTRIVTSLDPNPCKPKIYGFKYYLSLVSFGQRFS